VIVVDGPSDEIPARRNALPLVKEHRGLAGYESAGVRFEELKGAWRVECVDGASAALGSRGLANPFGALQRDRGQRGQELVELGVYDPGEVFVGHVLILPCRRHLLVDFDGS